MIATPTISYPLSGGEFALVIAALRLLEDEMTDCGEEGEAIAAESVRLRAKLRAIRQGGVRRADIIALVPRSEAP